MKRALLAIFMLGAVLAHGQVLDAEAAAAQQAVQTLHMAAEGRIAADQQAITDANAKAAAAQAALDAANAQITALQSTFTWRGMEWTPWDVNCTAPVGGGGKGTGSQNDAPGAWFSITPVVPAAGTANYFDCYWHVDTIPNDALTSFSYTLPWTFPTAADAAASQALEMEIRQSLPGGLQGVWALQMEFSGKQLRIWDNSRAWFSTGVPQPRLTPGVTYKVTLEGHRDVTAGAACYDAITINAVRTPLTYCYPLFQKNWRPMMRLAAQLDGNGAGVAYKVMRGPTAFTAR